jgi:hypothetical protein
MSIQVVLIILGGVTLLGSTVALVRRQLLSIRYGIGWLAVSLLAICGAPALQLLATQVAAFGLTPTGFSLGVLIAFLGVISLQLSISLSSTQRVLQDLAEHAALVEQRLRDLEAEREKASR